MRPETLGIAEGIFEHFACEVEPVSANLLADCDADCAGALQQAPSVNQFLGYGHCLGCSISGGSGACWKSKMSSMSRAF